jgi:hypothetical protein
LNYLSRRDDSETAAQEDPAIYYPFLTNILLPNLSILSRLSTERPAELLSLVEDLVESYGIGRDYPNFDVSAWRVGLGMHESVPKLQAYYAVHDGPVVAGITEDVAECDTWVWFDGKGHCTLEELRVGMEASLKASNGAVSR